MTGSILNTTKELLDIETSDPAFDSTLVTFINGVFTDLDQLGVGPRGGYAIMGADETWEDYLGANNNYASVQTYIGRRVKQEFDPPQTSFHMSSLQALIDKAEWRLSEQAKEEAWVASQIVVVLP